MMIPLMWIAFLLFTIISTVNTLAEIMHKAIDSCCKDDWGTREVFKPNCDC